jgi:hypothetical protein
MGAPQATDVAALYRGNVELLRIPTVGCVYSLAAKGTFHNKPKTDMGALRERILFKFVVKAP